MFNRKSIPILCISAVLGIALNTLAETFPFFVYDNDEEPQKNHYKPSGFVGDTPDVVIESSTTRPKQGKTCLKISYNAQKSFNQGWAGIIWQEPENNWGNLDGGYDLSGASQLTFWARGEEGGERLTFLVGGAPGKDGKKGNTTEVKLENVILTKSWKKYTIDLKDRDLSNIISGFGFVVGGNVCVFYLDRIAYQGPTGSQP